ncbi:MAG: phosphopantetheine-binding protein [Thermoguttaceae bacterium]|jgi:acyl carrier protein
MSLENSPVCEAVLSRSQVLEQVRRIVAESSGVPLDEIEEERPLLRELPWDSLDLVECVMEIEEEFDVSVPDALFDEAKTVGDITDGVLVLLKQPSSKG